MSILIQLRRGTAAGWTAANPTLATGEIGLETDTGKVKVGDGATAWTSLSYSFVGLPKSLTGAVAATRYAGATASGAPVAGTFAVGDFVIDQTGLLYICTVAGTPGTWVLVTAAHAAAADPHTGYVLESLFDAKGDLITASADNTPAKLTVGANSKILVADSSQAGGLIWNAREFTVGAELEGAPPSNGLRMIWKAPFACTVTNVEAYFDAGTNIVVNARNGASTFLAANLTVSSAATWTDGGAVQNTAIAANDTIEVNLVSTSGAVTKATIQVRLTRP